MNHMEWLKRLRNVASPEELLTLAKVHGIDLTWEAATAYYEKLRGSVELTDEELDNVAGGCGNSGGDRDGPPGLIV